jgi:hypothetical protein
MPSSIDSRSKVGVNNGIGVGGAVVDSSARSDATCVGFDRRSIAEAFCLPSPMASSSVNATGPGPASVPSPCTVKPLAATCEEVVCGVAAVLESYVKRTERSTSHESASQPATAAAAFRVFDGPPLVPDPRVYALLELVTNEGLCRCVCDALSQPYAAQASVEAAQ